MKLAGKKVFKRKIHLCPSPAPAGRQRDRHLMGAGVRRTPKGDGDGSDIHGGAVDKM